MARWLMVLLSNGRGPDGDRVLQEEALQETTKAVMPPPGLSPDLTKPEFPISDVEQSYGLGWVTSNYRGFRKIWHSGGIVTYSSRLWLLPDVDAGLFVATNGPQTADKGHALTAITSLAADLLLGESLWLNASTVCTFPAPWKPAEGPPCSPPSAEAASKTQSENKAPGKVPDHEDGSLHRTTTKGTSLSSSSSSSASPDSCTGSDGCIRAESERNSTAGDRPAVSLQHLVGVYVHKAFGEMVIVEPAHGNGVTVNDVRIQHGGPGVASGKNQRGKAVENAGTIAGNRTENSTISSEQIFPLSSDLLILQYGRFGRMELRRTGSDEPGDGENGSGETWEGRFVGPLWYVTASDESYSPVQVRFLRNKHGTVDRVLYPIDGRYDDVVFRKMSPHADVTTSSSNLSSAMCRGSRSGFGWTVVVLVGVMFCFNFIWTL